MKRFLFFVAIGILVTLWLRSHSRNVAPAMPPPTPVFVQYTPAEDARGTRETVDGIPVPVYPGSLVTEAEIQPPVPPVPPVAPAPPAPPAPRHVASPKSWLSKVRRGLARVASPAPGPRSVEGLISATEERAKNEAKVQLRREVSEWLDPEVPASWKPPVHLVDRLVTTTHIKPVVKDYGTLYIATLDANLSAERRAEFVEAYRRDLVEHRLTVLGGLLGFLLTCLAALAGYIRADEATKGYYTNWLRGVAAAGVGASGVLIYQMLV